MLSCEAVGGEPWALMPAAAGIELVHNFSLIHDDIEDASYERHHRPTVWRLWGQSQAINAGDVMFALAYLALLRLRQNGIADEEIASSVRMLSLACLDLCEGQYMDVDYENRLDVTVEDYLGMAARKTGALFALSTSLGAYLGGENGKLMNSFHLFGNELGMGYQIRDDILGIWGKEDAIGKSATDIALKKKTLPVVYGLQYSGGSARRRLERLYSRKSIGGEDVGEVSRILEQSGARNYAENLAERYYGRALTHLEATGLDTACLAPLKEIACFILDRDLQEGKCRKRLLKT
jgi:geranylgeranyl diphosphate synthase type I